LNPKGKQEDERRPPPLAPGVLIRRELIVPPRGTGCGGRGACPCSPRMGLRCLYPPRRRSCTWAAQRRRLGTRRRSSAPAANPTSTPTPQHTRITNVAQRCGTQSARNRTPLFLWGGHEGKRGLLSIFPGAGGRRRYGGPVTFFRESTLMFRRGMSARAWLAWRQRLGFSPFSAKSGSLQAYTTGWPIISSTGIGSRRSADAGPAVHHHQNQHGRRQDEEEKHSPGQR